MSLEKVISNFIPFSVLAGENPEIFSRSCS